MRSIQVDDRALVEHHESLVEIESWLGAVAVAESTDYMVTFDQSCSTGDSGQFTGQPTMSILWTVTPRTGAGERGAALIGSTLRKAEWRKTEEAGSEFPRDQYEGMFERRHYRVTLESSYTAVWLRVENLALGGVPAERIRTIDGLTHVLAYLDARRAPL